MSRTPKVKELINTRLASNYGGWFYCENCNKTIGYLCYVTYDDFCLEYKCKCGGSGSMHITFDNQNKTTLGDKTLITIKNRLCCPYDSSPLFTLLSKNLDYYKYEVLCTKCNTKFMEEKTC